MAEPSPRFQLVSDDDPVETAPAATPAQPALQRVSTDMLVMALRALSQRAVVALASLQALVMAGSVFALFYLTPNPSLQQIGALTIYSLFILAIMWLGRRK